MKKNLDNNTENNVNVTNSTDTVQVNTIPASDEIIHPASTVSSTVTDGNSNATYTVPNSIQSTIITEIPAGTTNPNVTPIIVTQTNGNNNAQEDYYRKVFVMMGIIVGGVLLISGILLYFLLNGTIENRNRLTCTKTVQGDGYEEHIKRYYTFDGGIMKRIYVTHTFTYDELTDDMYNQTFDEIINNDTHFVTKYGLGTNIVRENNVVTINAYDINYTGADVKVIDNENKKENFTCK